jgi:hypothetical protein
MQKRHSPSVHAQTLQITLPVKAVGSYLSTAKLKRAAKLREQLEALKKQLAQVLSGVN